MTGCANKRCSIGWNRSSSRCSTKPTSDIGEGDRRRTPCAKCGKRSRAAESGSWTQTSRIFFGSVDYAKLLTLVAQRVADGRVLRLIEAMLKAGSYGKGRLFPTEPGTPQGGVMTA